MRNDRSGEDAAPSEALPSREKIPWFPSMFDLLDPNLARLDGRASLRFVLRVLHPEGLYCPNGHPWRPSHHRHDHAKFGFVYRCATCGKRYHVFTGTMWHRTRYSVVQMAFIFLGILHGAPTSLIAKFCHVDRSHLGMMRPTIQEVLRERLGLPLRSISCENQKNMV